MRTRIQEMWLKVKYGAEAAIGEWGLILVVFLVALSSFGLGRLSTQEASKPAVSVAQAPIEAAPKGMAIGGLVVASRSGTVYQYPWCGGADNIKPENQVWFKIEEAAIAAGYRAAKNCKGLGDGK